MPPLFHDFFSALGARAKTSRAALRLSFRLAPLRCHVLAGVSLPLSGKLCAATFWPATRAASAARTQHVAPPRAYAHACAYTRARRAQRGHAQLSSLLAHVLKS